MSTWHLDCSACDHTQPGDSLASVCPACGQPLLVHYESPWPVRSAITGGWDMWRYRAVLPLRDGESPVSLGEGATPMHDLPRLASEVGVAKLWVKDEGLNPTASFKARGMSAAVTRAKALNVPGMVVPTAGNAGAALAAYGARAGIPVRVYAPESTPSPILATIRALGADLQLVAGHIGDAGKQSRAFATEQGWFDMSTLREPYRIEGKKTMGIEIAEQLGWMLPTHIIYPTGGGTGLIGMWKVFAEMRAGGWLRNDVAMPRMIVAQADGCAPMVRAFHAGDFKATPWENPETHASGLRVPGPLGDRLILRALRESNGDAASVSEDAIREATLRLSRASGVDAAPEGGCALAVLETLVREGRIGGDARVVVFNTGSGASYRF
ncbi:MAG: Pyridoxal-5-phosphate-dependent protein beta subunit [Gemmatimonadetes bacterium]|jgi:threonine synthase|nr:Pyridoxal-5-phosphate-dependent protein beta subunit [Gemmatimonadota bacterium]